VARLDQLSRARNRRSVRSTESASSTAHWTRGVVRVLAARLKLKGGAEVQAVRRQPRRPPPPGERILVILLVVEEPVVILVILKLVVVVVSSVKRALNLVDGVPGQPRKA
jgi:hypothetical protein